MPEIGLTLVRVYYCTRNIPSQWPFLSKTIIMKKLLMLTVLSLFFVSCKKEKNTANSTSEEPSYHYITSTGSYWVYDRYQIDSLGNEILVPGKDSIVIAGDTTINGKVYFKHVGASAWYSNQAHFERDSTGYIVDEHGAILYSFNNVAITLNSAPDGQFFIANKLDLNENMTTNFGLKNAAVRYAEISMNDGSPVNNCGDLSMRFYHYYVSGIGMIQDETETFSGLMSQCSKKRRKLSSYHIVP